MLYPPLPDDIDALINFLSDHAALAPLHGGRVSTRLIDHAGSRIRVTSLGGPQPHPWEGITEHQVECWGGTEKQAKTLAETVLAAIYDMRGPIPGGWCESAVPTLRPLASHDPDTGRPRFIVQVQLTTLPNPA